jgi:hypothetical protein
MGFRWTDVELVLVHRMTTQYDSWMSQKARACVVIASPEILPSISDGCGPARGSFDR